MQSWSSVQYTTPDILIVNSKISNREDHSYQSCRCINGRLHPCTVFFYTPVCNAYHLTFTHSTNLTTPVSSPEHLYLPHAHTAHTRQLRNNTTFWYRNHISLPHQSSKTHYSSPQNLQFVFLFNPNPSLHPPTQHPSPYQYPPNHRNFLNPESKSPVQIPIHASLPTISSAALRANTLAIPTTIET